MAKAGATTPPCRFDEFARHYRSVALVGTDPHAVTDMAKAILSLGHLPLPRPGRSWITPASQINTENLQEL